MVDEQVVTHGRDILMTGNASDCGVGVGMKGAEKLNGSRESDAMCSIYIAKVSIYSCHALRGMLH